MTVSHLRSGRFFLKWVEKNDTVGRFFSKFGFALNSGVSILLLFTYLAPFVPPDIFWPLSLIGLGYKYLMVFNFIFMVLWALQRSKKVLMPLVALLTGFTYFTNTFQLIPPSVSGKSDFGIVSYNVHGFRSDLRSGKRASSKIIGYLKSSGAEIICLQEATMVKSGKLSPKGIKEGLPEIKHFQLASGDKNCDLATFSKYPMINKGEVIFPGPNILVIFADIKINSREILRVYNCHLQSYSIDPDDYSSIDSIGMRPGNRHIDEAKKISYKLRAGFKYRAKQARILADHIGRSPYPVVVCGDFNDTPVSYAYRKVRGDLQDAFVAKGWGTSDTYNGDLPSFRIDYILFDQKLDALNYKCDRVSFSDHFPVRCQFSFKRS
jgi:endonuclease/exonuclease/phosphatase (EEP) superfamily protein YafD